MIVEVLYFQGCPNHAPARELLRHILDERGIKAEIHDVEVTDDADAQSKEFLGSPSIRVDGVDVEPTADAAPRFGMMCRVYRQGGASSGIPPRASIERAMLRAAAQEP